MSEVLSSARHFGIAQPLVNAEADLEELHDFFDINRGLFRVPGEMLALESKFQHGFQNMTPRRAAAVRARLRKVMAIAARANRHVEEDFDYVCGLGIIRLWATLEAAMTDFCIGALGFENGWRNVQSLQKVQVRIVDYSGLSQAEQIRMLYEALLTECQARRKPGFARYETVLKAMGFGGSLSEELRTQGVALASTRHVLVHNRGLADEKFRRECAWLSYAPNEPIRDKQKLFKQCHAAVRSYLAVVALRVVALGHCEMREEWRDPVGAAIKRLRQSRKRAMAQ